MSDGGGFIAGSIIGKLVLDNTGWNGKIREAGEDTKNLGTKVGVLSGAVKSLAGQFAVGLIAANLLTKGFNFLKDTVGDSIKASMDAEIAENNLRAALDSTGRSVPGLLQHFKDYSAELQKQTTFDDEAIQGAQALLLQLTKLDQDGLDEATKGAVGLASVFKINLQTATRAVAQGFEGNYTALGRMIPAVHTATTEADKQKAMMDGLAQMYQRAKSETETFGGALKQLNNAWNDAKERIGAAITGNENLQKAIHSVTDAIVKLVESGQLASWINGAVTVIKTMIDTVGQWAKAISDADSILRGSWFFRDVKSNMAEAIRAAKDEAIAFKDGLNILKPSMDEIQAAMEKGPAAWDAWTKSTKATDDQLAANKETIIGWIQKGADFLGLVTTINTGTTNLGNSFKDLGIKTKTELTAELNRAVTALGDLKKSGEATPGGLKALGDKIKDLKDQLYGLSVTTIQETFIPAARDMSFALDELNTTIGTTVIPAARNLADEIQAVADTMPNIATAAKPAFTTVKTDFGQLCTDIVTDWGNTLNTSLQEGWGFSHFLKEVWGDIWQNFGQLISDMAAKWVMDFITPTVDETKKIGTAISESVSGPVSDIADSAGQAASGFLSALGSVGSIITAIASVISLLKGPQKQTDVTYWLKLQWELLQNSYNFFIGELTWKLDTIKNAVDGTIKQGITKISTATQKSRDYLQTIASKNYLKDVVGYLKDIATGIENLPGAASGAVFMMPTLARLAEREPEIIMPLREYQTERIMPRVENRRQAPIVVNIKPIVIDKKDHYLIKFIQDNLNHNALRVPTACVRG